MRLTQEALPFQIRQKFIKNVPGWLRTKSLEKAGNTTVEKFFLRHNNFQLIIFAKQTILSWT